MRLWPVLLVACATPHVAADPEVGTLPWEAMYPVRPAVRATVGTVTVTGDVPHRIEVPYFRGLTLRLALVMAGRDQPPHSGATLDRPEGATRHAYRIPLRAIYAGLMPDPELAAGDHVIVDSDALEGLCADCE